MSDEKNKIKLFEEKQVRAVWDEEAEKWWFSIADICAILAESADGRKYWSVLKTRLKKEGSELATNCSQLKMLAEVAATDISIARQPSGYSESAKVAREGAETAKVAREQLEKKTGRPAVSRLNAKDLGQRNLASGKEGDGE
jgi:hypothetical protein